MEFDNLDLKAMCNLESALIPQPLLPMGKRGADPVLAPLPFWERGWGFDVSAQPNGEGSSGKLHIAYLS